MDDFDNEFNYRNFRNGRSSVPCVKGAIRLLQEEKVPFEIRATLTSDNPYLYKTHRFFEDLKVPYQIAFADSSENKTHEELNTFTAKNISSIQDVYGKLLKEYEENLKMGQPIYNNLIGKFSQQLE